MSYIQPAAEEMFNKIYSSSKVCRPIFAEEVFSKYEMFWFLKADRYRPKSSNANIQIIHIPRLGTTDHLKVLFASKALFRNPSRDKLLIVMLSHKQCYTSGRHSS